VGERAELREQQVNESSSRYATRLWRTYGGLIGIEMGGYFLGTQPLDMGQVSLTIVTLMVCYHLPSKLSGWRSRSSRLG
jgi:hypothetical protein